MGTQNALLRCSILMGTQKLWLLFEIMGIQNVWVLRMSGYINSVY